METTLTVREPKVKTLDEVRALLRAEAPRLAREYTLRVDGIFGSYARGDQTVESDVDLLVSFDRVPGLIGLIGMERDLSDRLGVKVQLTHNDGCDFVRRVLPGSVRP